MVFLLEFCEFEFMQLEELGLFGGSPFAQNLFAVLLDLVVRSAGLDALRVVLGVPARDGAVVLLVDQQPWLAAVAVAQPRLDDRIAALELRPSVCKLPM